MKNFIKIGMFLFLLAACMTLSACGKVSSPVPLEGSGYPHTYPRH